MCKSMKLFLILLTFVAPFCHSLPNEAMMFDPEARNFLMAYKQYPNIQAQYETFEKKVLELYTDEDIQRIFDSLFFSVEKHRFQTRKDQRRTPYIIHPLGVANYLLNIGKVRDPDIIIAALLHDTVEDTDTTFEEIQLFFGSQVENYVREVTDDKSLPKASRKQLQIENAPHKSEGAVLIKLADKLYNLTDLSTEPPVDWDKERIDAYFKWAQAVVDQLPLVNIPLKRAVDKIIEEYWQNKK